MHANILDETIGIGEARVTYSVYIEDTKVDPDLIIDGGGGVPLGGKKKSKKRGGKKR